MACHFNENVYTTVFTPREYQVELLDTAKESNTIVCLGNNNAKIFLAVKLLQELASEVRKCRGKRSLFLLDAQNVEIMSSHIKNLTDLSVRQYESIESVTDFTSDQWKKEISEHEVLVMTSDICMLCMHSGNLALKDINLLAIDDCRLALKQSSLRQLFREYSSLTEENRPRILGLTTTILCKNFDPARLEAEFEYMEKLLFCNVDTSSDIVMVLRYCSKPYEKLLVCKNSVPCTLSERIVIYINNAKAFLEDHRYDPFEIYEEEFHEELQEVPDPKHEPNSIFDEFLEILYTMGPWCADRAAFALLIKIENLKVKTPYERHYLLLCMVSTVMVNVRALCDQEFETLSDNESIYAYSTPRVLRLLQVLKTFKPDTVKKQTDVTTTATSPVHTVTSDTPSLTQPSESSAQADRTISCSIINNNCDNSENLDSKCVNDSVEQSNVISTTVASTEEPVTEINNTSVTDTSTSVTDTSTYVTDTSTSVTDTSTSVTDTSTSITDTSTSITDTSTSVTITDSPVTTTITSTSVTASTSDTITNCTSTTSSSSSTAALPTTTTAIRPWKGRVARGHRKGGPNIRTRPNYFTEPDSLCAVVFVEKRFTAKILYYLINELCHCDEDFSFLSVQYTVEKIADPTSDNREAEIEHRKQEEVLKKFRMHECNLLIATSVLEEGIDVPKCNLVIRFDQPSTYNSYVQCKGRAKMPEAYYILLSEEDNLNNLIRQLAQYKEIEKMLLKKCKNREPTEAEEREADLYTGFIQPYSPSNSPTGATVNVATAVALVNKYCAKLPSDTFTRLTPLWSMQNTLVDGTLMYICSIRLPINSPLKKMITGAQMPNRVLARRIAALQVCKLLHQIGELDDNLLPVGKESFRAFEEDWNNFPLEESDELLTRNNLEPRPGTTKRRQYYYKKVAETLTDCRPLASVPVFLYLITMTLTCPLPEEQNTRGRKIYPPEDSAQGFGILTLKQIPKICPFPIFTRSGEVQVGLELALSKIIMTPEQLEKIMEFLNYIFTNVLRLQKYLMLFDPNASENSYFIVPTYTNETGITDIDWNFLNEIYENRDLTPHTIPEADRKDFKFNAEMYQDAVVMPWYRNQDQPQYFYVAEICNHLNPKSSFPGIDYKTFEEYYYKKYDIQIQNLEQPLLDVDHTSARLNFLTPRYVNRKGVALPTSSEETKRAKRENLEQKQILVPELCTVHPFPASLWRKAVCLPCILYRINALLLADQIRKQVAEELALGQVELPADFHWPPLNFGWSLSDVLKKSKENRPEKVTEKRAESPEKQRIEPVEIEEGPKIIELTEDSESSDEKKPSLDDEEEEKNWLEIGTWSNEMATCDVSVNGDSLMEELPDNITMCGNQNSWNGDKMGAVRYGSPTSWMQSSYFDDYDSDDSTESYCSEPESSVTSNKSSGLRIEFKSDNVAEAIDVESGNVNRALMIMAPDQSILTDCDITEVEVAVDKHVQDYSDAVEENIERIKENGIIIPIDVEFALEKKSEEVKQTDEQYKSMIKSSLNLSVINFDCEPLDIANENPVQPILPQAVENDPDFEEINFNFSFDFQPDLNNHPGPSPSVILQALTMSNANDGINLERLETIGDSFLKYAITNYLYSTYDNIHEGKLSHLRSKQVSNLNLYRLGRLKVLGESMIATKFDPHDNWLPPCYYVPKELEQALIDARVPASHWNRADMPSVRDMSKDEICQMVREKGEKLGVIKRPDDSEETEYKPVEVYNLESLPCFIPYNLITQHSIPDKSVADCVEALIGAYLIECGPRGALLFMAWLGIRVLPKIEVTTDKPERPTGSLQATQTENGYKQVLYGELTCPRSPFLYHCPNPELELEKLLDGYDEFERKIQYRFRDRSYLLQALTHASYSPNTVTDCYQRLEFLGDAVLDYLITRHLYEDPRLHSPGALTDLRSALVNNTIFASLAVRHGFHKYFRHLSPGLHDVVNRFVQIQEENGHSISEEYYLITEDESEEIEDVEVPKALGDVFESVAGAIFLDSGMSLDAVWRVYYRMMRNEIEQFSTSVPKSPIRELLELEPETAKFGKPEKLADGRRVRVTVEVFGKGTFKGIGRNYRIAKCTAAKCALKQLKKRGFLVRKN